MLALNTCARWWINLQVSRDIFKLVLKALDILIYTCNRQMILLTLAHSSMWWCSFKYVATTICSSLAYGSSAAWHELSSQQLLSWSKNSNYIALVKPLFVFIIFFQLFCLHVFLPQNLLLHLSLLVFLNATCWTRFQHCYLLTNGL